MKLRSIYLDVCTFLTASTVLGQDVAVPASVTPPVKTPWDLSAAAGLTLTRGNSDTLLFTANFQGVKKWTQNEMNVGVDGVYGENDSVKNAQSIHGYSQYNRLFTDRFFGYLRVEGLHDGIADIDYRLSVGPGVGYYFIKETNATLRAEVGPGYVYQRDGDGETRSYISLRLAERFDYKLNERVKIWESVEILPQVDKISNFIVTAEVGVESGMTEHLALQAYIQDIYYSEPAAGREKNDVRLVAGVKYKF